jgi:hypothetical protein
MNNADKSFISILGVATLKAGIDILFEGHSTVQG